MKKIIIIFIFFFTFFFIKTEKKNYFLNRKFLENFTIAILTVYLGYKYDVSRNQLNELINKFDNPFYAGKKKENTFEVPEYNDFKKNEINLNHLNNLNKEINENLKKGCYFFHKIEVNQLKININQWIEVNEFFRDHVSKDETEIIKLNNDKISQKKLIESLIKRYAKNEENNENELIKNYKLHYLEYLKNFQSQENEKEKKIKSDKEELQKYICEKEKIIKNTMPEFKIGEGQKVKIFIQELKKIIKEIEESIEPDENLKNENELKNFKYSLLKVIEKFKRYLKEENEKIYKNHFNVIEMAFNNINNKNCSLNEKLELIKVQKEGLDFQKKENIVKNAIKEDEIFKSKVDELENKIQYLIYTLNVTILAINEINLQNNNKK